MRHVVALAAVLAFAGCANMATRAPSQVSLLSTGSPLATPVAEDEDLLLKLMQGQFALQAGDSVAGAQGYAAAAQLSSDPAVADQATHLALASRQWALAESALARWQQLAPKAPGIAQARAWIALGQGRVDDAYADLQTVAAGADSEAWRLIAQVLLSAPDKPKAVQLLARLATPDRLGDKETLWIAVSQLAFKLDGKALAKSLSDQAVQRFHGEQAYAWSARLAIDRGDPAAAREAYTLALKRDPGSVHLRTGYAALLGDAGDNAGAARVLGQGAQDDITYAARAAYAARADDKSQLAALYRQMEGDDAPRSGKRLFLLGQVAELNGNPDQALSWYRQVPLDDDNWFGAQTRQAVVLDQQGKLTQALDLVHRLQTELGDDVEMLGNAYLLEADLLTRHDRDNDALAVYTRALEGLPEDTRLLYAKALLQIEMGNVDAGERSLRRIIDMDPDDAEALNALGYTLADRTDRQKEALALIERAYRLKPDEPAIIDSLGWVQFRLGDLDDAVKNLRRAYESQPDPEIAAHLGEVLWVSGNHDEARRIWEQGRKKDASNKALLETMQRLGA